MKPRGVQMSVADWDPKRQALHPRPPPPPPPSPRIGVAQQNLEICASRGQTECVLDSHAQ